jgi:hypothetical protein
MSNPSTIWASLSSPLSPIGDVPFVGTDGVTIQTDATGFIYTQTGATLTDTMLEQQLTVKAGLRVDYDENLIGAVTAATINTISGRFVIGSTKNTKVVTCNKCYSSSIVLLNIETSDATLTRLSIAVADGSFTVTGNAAATNNVTVSYIIFNPITT